MSDCEFVSKHSRVGVVSGDGRDSQFVKVRSSQIRLQESHIAKSLLLHANTLMSLRLSRLLVLRKTLRSQCPAATHLASLARSFTNSLHSLNRATTPTAPAPLIPSTPTAPPTSSFNYPTQTTTMPIQLKVPKGTKDWDGRDDTLRSRIFDTIKTVFERRGAEPLDTPVFELREILAGKYGEDSKLIYDLADQGGEICSLRYDLTVPFARYLAMNGVQTMKRYQFGKVYRRDQPAMTKGRMREFWQCDYDIAGVYDSMIPDAEILRAVSQVFDALGWRGQYTIKINHRKVLDGIFAVCGVPEDKFRTISSAVDKLDKSPWEEVRREMTEEKGLDGEVAEKIGGYVNLKGGAELLQKLQADEALSANESAKAGLADMQLLFDYLSIFQVLPVISFDMSLARGLDYYTGVIYEVITEGSAPGTSAAKGSEKGARSGKKEKKAPKGAEFDEDRSSDPNVGVGSVAAGGRYDNLVNMFSGKGQIPCVGVSFGVERIFSIMKARTEAAQARDSKVDVFVVAFPKGLLKERMGVGQLLENAGFATDYMWKDNAKFQKQFAEAEKGGIPYSVILGENELKEGNVKIKQNGLPDGHPEKEGVTIKREDLVQEMQKRLEKDPSKALLRDVQSLAQRVESASGSEKDALVSELLKKLSTSNGHVEALPLR